MAHAVLPPVMVFASLALFQVSARRVRSWTVTRRCGGRVGDRRRLDLRLIGNTGRAGRCPYRAHSVKPGSMALSLIDLILGRRLGNREAGERQLAVTTGVPAMGLDAIGSASYGPARASCATRPAFYANAARRYRRLRDATFRGPRFRATFAWAAARL